MQQRLIARKAASKVAIDSSLARSEESSRRGLQAAVALLSTARTYRDADTVEHECRVATLAVGIGTQLGLSSTELKILRLSGLLHDVGKVAVPEAVVGKPGKFTDDEYALMKGHCLASYNILLRLDTAWPIADIAYQHHERIDGSGYPRELSGKNILLEARILAVADVYDAMVSSHPYRSELSRDFVLGELQQMAGRQLDEAAVDACGNFILHNVPGSSH